MLVFICSVKTISLQLFIDFFLTTFTFVILIINNILSPPFIIISDTLRCHCCSPSKFGTFYFTYRCCVPEYSGYDSAIHYRISGIPWRSWIWSIQVASVEEHFLDLLWHCGFCYRYLYQYIGVPCWIQSVIDQFSIFVFIFFYHVWNDIFYYTFMILNIYSSMFLKLITNNNHNNNSNLCKKYAQYETQGS